MTVSERPKIVPLDAAAFAADAERVTNEVLLEEWLSLYHPEAVAEWMMDGAYERHEGLPAIRVAATGLARVWKEHNLQVKKTVECADDESIVLTWRGGFRGGSKQFGTEIWTLRDGLVVRHQMYGYFDVRSSDSWLARLRVFASDPRTTIALVLNSRH
mgnify:CR=1 FL=1